MLEYMRQQRPDIKWVVHLLTKVTFYVNKINNHPIGGGVLLSAYVSNNPGLSNLTGFNSGRYDINAMQIDFFSHLAERNLVKYAMKRNNTFMAVKTEKLKFLDIANYLAPGFSYSQYLKSYGCSEEKGHFPYEWMTSLGKLNVSQLPPHEAFFSTLKNENICAEDYQLCQRVWEDNNMKTMKSSWSGTTTKR
jgi:hypothetical protein